MYSAKSVANFFITKSMNDDTPVNHLKLHKLIYNAHGCYLALYGRPLLDERIVAFKYGPAIRSIYEIYWKYGKEPIYDLACENIEGHPCPALLPNESIVMSLLEQVWESCRDVEGLTLASIAHADGTPWHKTFTQGKGKNSYIDDKWIEHWFKIELDLEKRNLKLIKN